MGSHAAAGGRVVHVARPNTTSIAAGTAVVVPASVQVGRAVMATAVLEARHAVG